MRILLVEDEPRAVQMLAKGLREEANGLTRGSRVSRLATYGGASYRLLSTCTS